MDTSSFYHSEWHEHRSKVKVFRVMGPPLVAKGYRSRSDGCPKDRVLDAPSLGAQLGWAPTICAHGIGLKAIGVVRTDSVLSRKSSKRVQCEEPTVSLRLDGEFPGWLKGLEQFVPSHWVHVRL